MKHSVQVKWLQTLVGIIEEVTLLIETNYLCWTLYIRPFVELRMHWEDWYKGRYEHCSKRRTVWYSGNYDLVGLVDGAALDDHFASVTTLIWYHLLKREQRICEIPKIKTRIITLGVNLLWLFPKVVHVRKPYLIPTHLSIEIDSISSNRCFWCRYCHPHHSQHIRTVRRLQWYKRSTRSCRLRILHNLC